MADLGALGYSATKVTGIITGLSLPTPIFMTNTAMLDRLEATNIVAAMPTMVLYESDGLNYLCEGVVSVLGTPTAGYTVRAFRRDTGGLLGQATSGVGGVFSIGFNGFDGEVTCIAYDDTGTSPDYNAVVFDRVVPVLA